MTQLKAHIYVTNVANTPTSIQPQCLYDVWQKKKKWFHSTGQPQSYKMHLCGGWQPVDKLYKRGRTL